MAAADPEPWTPHPDVAAVAAGVVAVVDAAADAAGVGVVAAADAAAAAAVAGVVAAAGAAAAAAAAGVMAAADAAAATERITLQNSHESGLSQPQQKRSRSSYLISGGGGWRIVLG